MENIKESLYGKSQDGIPADHNATVSELKESQRRLTLENSRLQKTVDRYRSILSNIRDGYFEVDLCGNFTFFNEAMCGILGYRADEISGMNYTEYVDKQNEKKVFAEFNKTFITGRPSKPFDWVVTTKSGDTRCVEAQVSLSRDDEENPRGFFGIVRDITERKRIENELTYLAYHDPLTGLLNRKAFLEQLAKTLVHSKRYDNERVILFTDLDNFKIVNDRFGHEIGDRILKEAADRLILSLRNSDFIARYGGDEFTIILNNKLETCSEAVAERLLRNISAPYDIDGNIIDFITISIGISRFPTDGKDVQTLIRCADQAMYTAKEKGNCYIFYNRDLND